MFKVLILRYFISSTQNTAEALESIWVVFSITINWLHERIEANVKCQLMSGRVAYIIIMHSQILV